MVTAEEANELLVEMLLDERMRALHEQISENERCAEVSMVRTEKISKIFREWTKPSPSLCSMRMIRDRVTHVMTMIETIGQG